MYNRYKFMTFFLILLLGVIPLAAATVSGFVGDGATGAALPGANIVIENSQRGTISNTEGQYNIALDPGTYTISASYIGYHITKKNITVTNGTNSVIFELAPLILAGQTVSVTANRARERETPVSFTNISQKDIAQRYYAQDVPMVLTEVPGVYAYSDAGNGLGYTYLKIRGFDQKRVQVMLNGIPLNDPEDHQVYWVDMPDFMASVQDIQIQRGVGSSLSGSSAFGGSVNVQTHELNTPQKILVTTGTGSYNTRKFSLNLHSGLINNTYSVAARFSKVVSDGYRDNSAIDMWAYFLSASRYGLTTTTKINVYGGTEMTHAAWNASSATALAENHRDNPITYPNTIDNFTQPHYELLHEWRLSDRLTLFNTFYFIQGSGYYEVFKSGRKLVDYGYQPYYLSDSTQVKRTDLVRQKWVEKDQTGWIGHIEWAHPQGTLSFGGDFYYFESDHFGKVLWANQLPADSSPEGYYHQYQGEKMLGTVFLHELWQASSWLSIMADLNLQMQTYDFEQQAVGNFTGADRHAYSTDYTFFNPKIGANINFSEKWNGFGNISMAHREPTDTDLFNIWQGPDDLGVTPLFNNQSPVYNSAGEVDYIKWSDPQVKAEQLVDFEFGMGYQSQRLHVKGNVYWMDFHNEIVPYSQVNDDGFVIKGNADRTVHRGIEGTVAYSMPVGLRFDAAVSLSQNYFAEFVQINEEYDDEWNLVGTTETDFSNNTIAGFPGEILNLKLSYEKHGLSTSLGWQYIGEQYLDNTENKNRLIDSYQVLNAVIAGNFPDFPGSEGLRVSLFLNNILDKKYETAGYYDAWEGENFYYPAAGRNFYLNFELSL